MDDAPPRRRSGLAGQGPRGGPGPGRDRAHRKRRPLARALLRGPAPPRANASPVPGEPGARGAGRQDGEPWHDPRVADALRGEPRRGRARAARRGPGGLPPEQVDRGREARAAGTLRVTAVWHRAPHLPGQAPGGARVRARRGEDPAALPALVCRPPREPSRGVEFGGEARARCCPPALTGADRRSRGRRCLGGQGGQGKAHHLTEPPRPQAPGVAGIGFLWCRHKAGPVLIYVLAVGLCRHSSMQA
mmetsp:Transcript_30154/g.83204  ORF Transcript_30154/g.83204 Transcript_30154/m.83204 type:complete len:247 (-) Transcript_30154:53-793(-)